MECLRQAPSMELRLSCEKWRLLGDRWELIRMPGQVVDVEEIIDTCNSVECKAPRNPGTALQNRFPHILKISSSILCLSIRKSWTAYAWREEMVQTLLHWILLMSNVVCVRPGKLCFKQITSLGSVSELFSLLCIDHIVLDHPPRWSGIRAKRVTLRSCCCFLAPHVDGRPQDDWQSRELGVFRGRGGKLKDGTDCSGCETKPYKNHIV